MEYHLMERFGLEIEYMIVDRDTLDIAPRASDILTQLDADDDGDLERGEFTWSNELTNHVLELKTTEPNASFDDLHNALEREVKWMSGILNSRGLALLPTSMHPWMDPRVETVLWPLGNHEIYQTYDRIFNCQGHGWANVQSTHLNLSFCGEEEFLLLHSAIRLLLPLLPALCASSPIVEEMETDDFDTRLNYYANNQRRVPEIAGEIIPEAITCRQDYDDLIYSPIRAAMAQHDKEGMLDLTFLNSRGAIARFDRGSIEIRVMDSQECPRADCAIAEFCMGTLKWILGNHSRVETLLTAQTPQLAQTYRGALHGGLATVFAHDDFLPLYGMHASKGLTIGDIIEEIASHISLSKSASLTIETILAQGNLAQRILRALPDTSRESLREVYQQLGKSLTSNTLFIP